MPYLDNLSKELKEENVMIITISQDKDFSKIESFYDNADLKNLIPYKDKNHDIANKLQIRGLPTTLIINKAGQEIARAEGILEWDSKEFINWVRTIN